MTSPPAPRQTSLTLRLAALLSLVGGFLDAYTYLSRNGVFATAQTGNIILMIVAGARDDWGRAAQHLPPIAAFLVGVLASEVLRVPAVVRAVRRPARVAVGLEAAVLVVVGFLPPGVRTWSSPRASRSWRRCRSAGSGPSAGGRTPRR